MSNTPLYDALLAHAECVRAALHMPGHHGDSALLSPVFGRVLSLDVTELPGTGDLLHPLPGDPIVEAERLMAKACSAGATVFSPGGCSAALAAMLHAGAGFGASIIADRRCHVAALNAMALLDMRPVYLPPRRYGAFCRVHPDDIAAAHALAPDAKALLVTSPDYTGACCDIAALRAVCDERGLTLLVDGAHGAHLAYHDGGALHSMRLGAHMCCESMHKTLPALTGAALLHVSRGSGLDADALRASLRLFSSTSPSYLVMASMDLCRAHMQSNAQLGALLDEIHWLDDYLRAHVGVGLSACPPPRDPFRITLELPGEAQAVADALRGHGVYIEAVLGDMLILIPSVEGDGALAVFAHALRDALMCRRINGRTHGICASPYYIEPSLPALTPRQAMAAARERIPLAQAEGRLAAEPLMRAPPCVPAALPGERISSRHVEMFCGILNEIYVIMSV